MLTLVIFGGVLFFTVFNGGSILLALSVGFFIFFIYAVLKGHKPTQVLRVIAQSIVSIKSLLITFLLVGALTASLRCCGTIPLVVSYAVKICHPETMLLATFLLNAGVSLLIGTCFGAAATVGMICTTVAASIGIEPAMVGGAVLAGIFVGDRASPFSSGAILVSKITGTDLYDNVRAMLCDGVIPGLLACILYLFLGYPNSEKILVKDISSVFYSEFYLGPVLLFPLALIPVLSLLRLDVKLSMLMSIISSVLLALFVQHMSPLILFRQLILGYSSASPDIDIIMHGGGVISMARTAAIITISSTYSEIFRVTGILNSVKAVITQLSRETSPFVLMLFVSLVNCAISCNQMFSVMLTKQLFEEIIPDRSKLALALENSTVMIAPMIPWSIAAAVPLNSINAPSSSILFAFYLYLVPLFAFFKEVFWGWKHRACIRATPRNC